MSKESAEAFINRIKTDEDFRKKVSDCKDSDARKACVQEEGFEFTAEELKEVGPRELSDDELDVVSGGDGYLGCCAFDWLHIAH